MGIGDHLHFPKKIKNGGDHGGDQVFFLKKKRKYYYYYKQSRYSDMIKSFAYMWFLCSSLEIKWAIGYDAKHGNKSLWIANNGFLMSLQNTYLPIFCIFHNSIRKSLCLIELALMHYTKKKDMNEHLGNILHFKYQPNNFFWSAYLPVPIIHKYTFKWVVMQTADSMALS